MIQANFGGKSQEEQQSGFKDRSVEPSRSKIKIVFHEFFNHLEWILFIYLLLLYVKSIGLVTKIQTLLLSVQLNRF